MAAKKQNVTPGALLELKMPGDVRVSPDGKKIAFGVSETEWGEHRVIQHLSVIATEGDAPARQVTRGASDEVDPRWSPDGKWLAFLSARDDVADEDDYDDADEPKSQVWLLPMDGLGGEAERLTDAPEGVDAYDWLPDSSGVVYLAREPRPAPLQTAHEDRQDRKDDAVVERRERFRHQIWRIDRDDKKARMVHPGDFGVGEIAVSSDGQWVAYTTNYTGEENDYHLADVWVVSLTPGEARPLTQGPGGKFHPVWSPDSRSVLFCRSLNPALSFSQENLFEVPLDGGEARCLTIDFPHDLIGWRGVGFDARGALYVSAAVGTTTGIFRRDPGRSDFEPLLHSEEHIHDFHVAPDGGVAYVASSPVDVPELLWLAAGAIGPETLTDLNETWAGKYRLGETEVVTYDSPDGTPIEALLTLPAGREERAWPLILSLHGGPHGRTVQALSPYSFAQALAGAGYAVLSPNYRGSEGYGEAFGTASQGDLGGGDYQDVIAGIDWAVREGLADSDRLGVIGSSYGGFLVNWIIARTDRFRAAVSQFGILSLVTDFSNSQAPRWDVEYLGGHPWEKPDEYARLSPWSKIAEASRTPVLIMHGEGDGNTFIANSQEMYQALRLMGRPVEFVRYPREGHGFFEPQHRLDEMRRVLAWFDRHVSGDGTPPAYRVGEVVERDGWELTVTGASVAVCRGWDEARRGRLVEVVLAIRDTRERGEALTLTPDDVILRSATVRRGRRPLGLPVEALGGKAVAEGRGWRFNFTTVGEEKGVAASLALLFAVGRPGGTYALCVKDFSPVQFDVPAADSDEKPEKSRAASLDKESVGE